MRFAPALRRLIGPLELIHELAGPPLLRLARYGIFGLWMFKLLLDPLWRLADLPRELFHPAGLLNLLPGAALDAVLTGPGLVVFWIATLLCLGLSLSGRALIFPAISAVLLTVYSSLIRGFGPAVHTDIPLLLAVYALAAFAWADRIAPAATLGQVRHRASCPLIAIAALLCLSYALVAFNRMVAGGLGVFTGDTMEVWAIDASLRGYYFNTNIGWHVPEWPLVAFMLKAGLPAVTLFEMTAPLCLAWPRFRGVFIPFMLSFHALSLVFMNIFFFDDMLLYLLLIDWSRRFPALASAAG
jgi:hypothetical protein